MKEASIMADGRTNSKNCTLDYGVSAW